MIDPNPNLPVVVSITQLILAALPMTLAAIASFIVSLRNHDAAKVAAARAHEAKQAASETTAKVEEVRLNVNGRLTELLEAVRAAGHLEGLQAAREHDEKRPRETDGPDLK